MRWRSTRRHIARGTESGYAVLMALFLVASLLLIVTVATPSVLLEGRREREAEAVWRGNQYVRAIRLYFQKNGRYPATLEDLTKPGVSNVHFLRKVYSDPLNRADGSWRAIYMAPNGQLTGSVRYHSLQEMAAAQGVSVPAIAQQGTAQPAGAQPAAGQPAPSGSGVTQGAGGLSALSSLGASPGTPVPLQAVDGPVMGGLVIGIGSKIKQPSIRVYQGGETYFQWEFIFNPLMNGGQISAATPPAGASPANGQPATGQPAAQPAAGQTGASQPVTATPPASVPGSQ